MTSIKVLDHGYVRFVEGWGAGDEIMESEAGIIEAARMSTQGAFRGWDRDERLLRYLYEHKHTTPFEFAGAVFEIQAPIMVFRQWHRHRTQSYNEASARYCEMPAVDYVPNDGGLVDRIMSTGKNKQAGANVPISSYEAREATRLFLRGLETLQGQAQSVYQAGLDLGIPREIARLALTVSRYSKMRASASLRNWLGFLTLRCDPHAQWEIRQYAVAVADLLGEHFPRTMALWNEAREA